MIFEIEKKSLLMILNKTSNSTMKRTLKNEPGVIVKNGIDLMMVLLIHLTAAILHENFMFLCLINQYLSRGKK